MQAPFPEPAETVAAAAPASWPAAPAVPQPSPAETPDIRGAAAVTVLPAEDEDRTPTGEPEVAQAEEIPVEKDDQANLDSALEFYRASKDFWEQGDLENALAALDESYSLILKVEGTAAPHLLQQREDLRLTIARRIIEIYSSRFTVANGNRTEIPLIMNQHVQRAIKRFQGPERGFFLRSYSRSGRYRPHIVRSLQAAGMPEELSWLPLIESGFNVKALSSARALGLWQFIASTGYRYGLERDRWVDERMDPHKSTAAAIAYLKDLHQIFGDWTTALASYNCGEGTVLRCIRSQKINYLDNFWDLYLKLPRETASYVPRFLAVLHILQDPTAYGFELPELKPELPAETVSIDRQVHLKQVAQQLGVPYEALKDRNPELRYDATPDRPYELRVPPGYRSTLLAKLPGIPVWRPPKPKYVVHRVRKGETLSGIAHRYRTSVRAIMAMNRLRSSRYIRVGQKLKVPAGRRQVTTARAAPAKSSGEKARKPDRYTVRKGDSLWLIARRFDTTTKKIQALNNLRSTKLQVGQRLKIPGGTAVAVDGKTREYRVSKGDSPYLIARKHRMDLSEFLQLNRLTPRSTIYPGQVLLVRAD